MSLQQHHYLIPRGLKPEGIVEFLRSHGMCVTAPRAHSAQQEFYDSFDWRLYEADLVLIGERTADHFKLHLRSLKSGLDIVAVTTAGPPGFARELPRGVLRDRLTPLLGERRLLPIVALERKTRTIGVLDDEEKIVANVEIERDGVITGKQTRPTALGERVLLAPMRGYPEPLNRLRNLIERHLGLVRLNGTVLDEALAVTGRRPLDYSSKPRIVLSREMSAGAAARRIFSALLAIIEANEDGARRDLDVEFLHDLRVAVRRTRSLLNQWKKILPPECAQFRQEFAWLGEVTGPARDLDVQLHDLADYAALLEIDLRGDLRPLREAIYSRRESERRRLLEALASPRYLRLKQGWRALIEASDGEAWNTETMQRPVASVANATIRRRHLKVCKLGGGLTLDSPDAQFHELRKQCKKLRYLLEFFAELYPRGEIKPLVKSLRRLQDNLGAYQDLSVQIAALPYYAGRMSGAKGTVARARDAVTLLLDQLEARKRDIHGEFAATWSRFERPTVHDSFARVFGE